MIIWFIGCAVVSLILGVMIGHGVGMETSRKLYEEFLLNTVTFCTKEHQSEFVKAMTKATNHMVMLGRPIKAKEVARKDRP